MLLTDRIESDLTQELPQRLAGYSYRAQQHHLCQAVAETIDARSLLLAEAETGTGKTLAYLVPALRHDKKVLISTHTKALQDQVMFRELPAVREALIARRSVALLKGRSNYLCPHRLGQRMRDMRQPPHIHNLLAEVERWSHRPSDCDLTSLPFDPIERGIGYMITASADQCLGRKCDDWDNCPLVKARQRACDADIVIANHSLLLADAALKSGEFGEVLPQFDVYILDEAHALADAASHHFGLQFGRHRFLGWQHDLTTVLLELGDEFTLLEEIQRGLPAVLDAYLAGDLVAAREKFTPLANLAHSRVERCDDLAKLADRASEIENQLDRLLQPDEGFIVWQEGEGEQLRHVLAPVETGPLLAEHLWKQEAAFVLLSATLRVSEKFDYACGRLGLTTPRTEAFASPFDYASQALTYLPRHLPAPGSLDYEHALLEELIDLLTHSEGRAFVLFTAHRTLRYIAPRLALRLPYQVLEQGKDGSKDHLLRLFRDDTHSVLCGTRGFWEGVDMPGATLSLVVIDKIPFAPPSDPLLTARVQRCEAAGGNGFNDIQLPEAIAALRQGMGRLIRTQSDHGVMALLDSRIHKKAYGREIMRNFPPAPVTAEIADVAAFFTRRRQPAVSQPALFAGDE